MSNEEIEKYSKAREMLCLPLDNLESIEEIKSQVENLQEYIGVFKIGLELYTKFGSEVVKLVQKLAPNSKIFLDLKFHDIPNTVQEVSKAATKMGVWMFNVHASGGTKMMQAAIQGAKEAISENSELRMPRIIGVTILTSLDNKSCQEIYNMPVENRVLRLATMTKNAGLQGIVSSAQDLKSPNLVKYLRNGFSDFILITPGIKLKDGNVGFDQERITTPEEAVINGSTLLVVGRTITGYKAMEEKQDATIQVLDSINDGLEALDIINAKLEALKQK